MKEAVRVEEKEGKKEEEEGEEKGEEKEGMQEGGRGLYLCTYSVYSRRNTCTEH